MRERARTPVVLAFPGQVYGPASWCEQLFLRSIAAGKAVTTLAGHDPMFSPIHVDHCGRALVHLLDRGEPGARYLLVDHQPLRARRFAEQLAEALGRPLKTRAVPPWLCSLLLGPVPTEYATAHTNFSRARLRSTGFTFRFPTSAAGVPAVVRRWPFFDVSRLTPYHRRVDEDPVNRDALAVFRILPAGAADVGRDVSRDELRAAGLGEWSMTGVGRDDLASHQAADRLTSSGPAGAGPPRVRLDLP